jgi:hypothetical protein
MVTPIRKNTDMKTWQKKTACFLAALAALLTYSAQSGAAEQYQAIRDLKPVGYWPADEGKGTVLHDRSGNGNHGAIRHVPWAGNLLDFTPDVFQWVQIPNRAEYGARAFTIGGWVFSRRAYGASGTLFIGPHFRAKWGEKVDGVQLKIGGTIDGKDSSLVEVTSGGASDVVGSAAKKTSIAIGQWQHLLFSYDSGTARLYVNGKLAHSASNVLFKPETAPLIIGSDVAAWRVWPPAKRSLDGSIRDMVVFDRALTGDEVTRLHRATKPEVQPRATGRGPAKRPRRDGSLPARIRTLRDPDRPRTARAKAALALGKKRDEAATTVPILLDVLETILKQEGTRLVRVEDVLRNALMRALLDLAPQDKAVRKLLGRALAKPILDALDLSDPYLAVVRPLVEAGRYMDALDAHRAHLQTVLKLPGHAYWGHARPADIRPHLPLRAEYADAFLSKGSAFSDGPYRPEGCKPADYTPVDTHDGATYMTVVERVPQAEVERQSRDVLRHPAGNPPATDAKWSRVRILKINPNGTEQEALLGGRWFIFDARDAKMDGWAVGIDKQGYVHLVGGQHNSPQADNYLPGSWAKMGIATGPKIMYWVSKEPGNIASMEFVGATKDPRRVPCGWMNYMNFARNPAGVLFLYGRDHIWTWGLYRYDVKTRRWTNLGGSPITMLQTAKKTNAAWSRSIADAGSGFGPSPHRVLVYAWQPGAYNFCRSSWGIRFDRTGRMHVEMGIHGVGEDARIVNGPVYAYSDDLGNTFHRADGTKLRLPLTVNPVPNHHADVRHHDTDTWLRVWTSLLQHAGYTIP